MKDIYTEGEGGILEREAMASKVCQIQIDEVSIYGTLSLSIEPIKVDQWANLAVGSALYDKGLCSRESRAACW